MPEQSEIEHLRFLIERDEQALKSLEREETEVIEHIAPRGFKAARSREIIMSEARMLEERLRENRLRLSALEH